MKRARFLFLPVLALLILLVGLLGLVGERLGHARAASTITITDCTNDTQLQTAISTASSGDTITFGCSGTITLTATLTISKNLTLEGSGQTVTLDGNDSERVLFVNSGVSFTLNTLTIAHGSAPTPSGMGGGGLRNNGGTVSISNSAFVSNSAHNGGGLLNNGGTVSISNSTFASNSAPDFGGGGLANFNGTMSISNSAFTHNSAPDGGGLFNQFGTMSISNSAFVSNSATIEEGGGLLNNGPMSISNSTFASNSAGDFGGGLENSGPMSISNSTFASNSATNGGGLSNFVHVSISNSTFANNSATNGGGLSNESINGVSIGGSIVANNTGGNCQNFGTIISTGYNLESGTDCGLTGTGDLQNTDPKLASSLANNGGPTQTLALQDGSPAINHIPTSACLVTTDQRGINRPQGPACEIGAFEFRVPTLSLPSSPLSVDATSPQGAAVSYSITASLPDDASATPTVSCSPVSGSTFPIGTTTVQCSASDAASPPDTTTGSFQVVVKGAAAQVNDQISLVNSFNLSPTGIQTSFDSQLQAVQADLAANNTAQACSDLTSFVNHVNAQSGKQLTVAQANQLLAAAEQIHAVLGC